MRKVLGTKCIKFTENTVLSSIWGFLGPLPTCFLQFYQWQATFPRSISLFSNLNHIFREDAILTLHQPHSPSGSHFGHR